MHIVNLTGKLVTLIDSDGKRIEYPPAENPVKVKVSEKSCKFMADGHEFVQREIESLTLELPPYEFGTILILNTTEGMVALSRYLRLDARTLGQPVIEGGKVVGYQGLAMPVVIPVGDLCELPFQTVDPDQGDLSGLP